MLGRRGAIALTCAAALLVPAAAHANAFDDTLKEYRQTGAVDGCKHSAEALAQAKAQTPEDIAQTAPGFPAQLAAAAEKRAKGCTKAEEQATSTSTAAAPAGTGTTGTTGTGTTGTGAATQPPAASTGATQAPFGTTTPPAVTQPPAAAPATQAAAQSTSSHRGARLALLVVAALLLMLLALWAFARWWAWEPRWLVRWRHATAEAGWRASAAWAEFTDWLRLGR
jgi:cobalamin biosynthesis Mg chelatase CobN